MSRSTISIYELSKLFPDQETARLYLESRMWPNGVRCPFCGSDRITTRKGGYYRCNACDLGENFTVRTNTVMERSKIPLDKWVLAMYMLVTARKGISSMQLAKEIGVTQKSAWFMLHRLREACGEDSDIDKLSGTIEVDEYGRISGAVQSERWPCSREALTKVVFALGQAIEGVERSNLYGYAPESWLEAKQVASAVLADQEKQNT